MSELRLVGDPETARITTTATLTLRTPIRWDVNGYYRSLGVNPDATRRELMHAYRARGGEGSPYLTYVFRQLLDRRVRAAYDAMPLGQPFPDHYLHARLLRLASLRASAENAHTRGSLTAADILFSLGLKAPEKSSGGFLDAAATDGFDGSKERDRHPSSTPGFWDRGYLLLASTCDDVARLAQWQESLSPALRERGIPAFTIGFHGIAGPPFIVHTIRNEPIVLLHEEEEVTGELTEAAATAAARAG